MKNKKEKQEKKKEREEITLEKEKLKHLNKIRKQRIKEVFTKQKRFLKARYNRLPIEEPVLYLHRRSGQVEFYEGVKEGLFEFKHSDGEIRFIIVNTNTQEMYGHTKDKYRGYIAHEDHPITGFPDPVMTCEQVNIIVEKSLNDIKKWKAKELQARGDMWWKIGLAIGAVILAIALFKTLVPTQPETVVQVVKETAQNITILG